MRFNRRIRFKINLDTYLATLRELRPKQEHAIFLTPSFLMAFSALKAYRPMYFSNSIGFVVGYSFILTHAGLVAQFIMLLNCDYAVKEVIGLYEFIVITI